MKLPRGKCPRCDKDVALRVPAGGDGSMLCPVPHTRWFANAGYDLITGKWRARPGWRPCDGVLYAAKERGRL